MSDTYIVTAKTIDEAIAKANRLYADADHEISYDILEMPKKGFLGIGAKDAMLKVTVNETKDVDLGSLVSDLRSMKIHTDRDGKTNEPKPQQQKAEKKQEQKSAENKPQPKQQKPEQKQQPKPQANNSANKPAPDNKLKTAEKNQPKPQQPKPEKKHEQKPAENKPQQKAPVNAEPKKEQAKPAADKTADVMPKDHTEVIVSAPVGLFDLPEKEQKSVWGKADKAEETKAAEAEAIVADAAEDFAEDDIPASPASKDNIKVAVTEAEMEYAIEFANTLLRNMQIDARAERGVCPEGETFETTEDAAVYPRIEIVGGGTGILIGHHGETLDAIQYLVNLSAIRKTRKTSGHGGDHVKIVVDVENYRTKREETLRALARRMAARAVKSKRNVFLEPMNAYERRIIHSELQNFADVSTHSVGSDKNRKIIITYEGADKQPQNSRRRGGKNRPEGQKPERQNSQKSEKPAAEKTEKTERPRPKKPQKMPIEQLPDFLASRSTEPDEVLSIED